MSQTGVENNNSSTLKSGKNSENSVLISKSDQPDSLPVPPTHLSLVEVGLPVQIHVGNLKHLPKQDVPTSIAQPGVPSSSLPLLANQTTTTTTSNTTNVRKANITGTTQLVTPTVDSSEPDWQALDPSSSVLSLDRPLESSKVLLRFKRNVRVTSQMVASITNQFKLPAKVDNTVPNVLAPSSSSNPIVSVPSIINRTSLPITTLPSLTLQNKLVALDQRNVEPLVRDKNSPSANYNNQKNSPNGSIHDLFHHSKLQAEAEKDIKQALAGYVYI